jgi:hypothetical protein
MKLRLQRTVIWMLIVILAAGGMSAFAATPRLIFPDTATHWSQKQVAKLAALGVVTGKSDGHYAPNDNVTQQEVIAMVVRLLGSEEEAKNLTNVGTSLQVAEWAKPYVLYALSKGILKPSEEGVNNGHINWGERSAKREWVAKIIVRALDKEQDALDAANVPTSFNDNGDISADALGYVNAAVKLGVITGTTDNYFYPLRTITRAEVASVFGKAASYVNSGSNTISGIVVSITNDQLRVRDAQGTIHAIALASDTAYYRYDQNLQVLKSEVRINRQVYVVTSDGVAVYVEVTADEEPTETITGELKSVDASSGIIEIVVDSSDVQYLLAPYAQVNDEDGSAISLEQLVPRSIVELKRSTVSSRVIEVTVRSKPLSKISTGVIMAISDQELTVRDNSSGQAEIYPLADQLFVSHKGKVVSLSDVVVSDVVSYKVVNGYVAEIEITEKYVPPVQGTFISVVEGKPSVLNIRTSEGKPAAYDLADNVTVVLDGMAAPTLGDIYVGDLLTLTLSSEEKVTSIRIENRNIKNMQMVTLLGYYLDRGYISIDDGKELGFLRVTDNTVVEVYGIEYPIDQISRQLKVNQRVDLVVTGDYVQRIRLSDSYTGTIKDYNPQTRRIVLSNPVLGDISLNLSQYAFVEILGQSTTSLTDVKIGDEVQLRLSTDQATVSIIMLKKVVKYKIDSINYVTRSLTLRDDSNKTQTIYLSNYVTIQDPGKAYPTINDLKVGQTVTVTYYGKSPVTINILEFSYGQLQSIDRINNRLIIETPGQKIVQIDTAKNFELYRNKEAIAVTALQPGDRISFARDKEGHTIAEVVIRQSKTMNRLESNNQISFLYATGEVETYTLSPNVIVRSGNSLIQLSALSKNDRLYVYIVNNEIVEIEKY